MDLRRIGDGHLSPLDLEAIERNLLDRMKAIYNDILALRDLNVAPGRNRLTHKMLYNDILPESAKAYSEMNSLDVIRQVSEHDRKLRGGLPAIVADGEDVDIYFEVGAVDDNETLDATAGAYGMRSGQAQEMEVVVRYEGDSASPITLTHVSDTATTETIENIGSESWYFLISNMANPLSGITEYYFSQKVTPGSSTTLKSISIYLKRSSTGFTSAKLKCAIYTDYPNVINKPWPDSWTGLEQGIAPQIPNKKAEAEIDLDTGLSTTGEWVEIEFGAPYIRLSQGRTYHVVLWVPTAAGTAGGTLSLAYQSTGTYTGGFIQDFIPVSYDYWGFLTSGAEDMCLKIGELTETSATLATPSSYAGWQEASADVDLTLAHDLYEKSNLADFYVTVPDGVAINAIMLRDKASKGEAHWRADHVRTPHITNIRSRGASSKQIWLADGEGGTVWGSQLGYSFVPSYHSSTAWDGDAKSGADGIIDLSAVFGVPAGVKAVSARIAAIDETVDVIFRLSRDSSQLSNGISQRTQVANQYIHANGIVPCDANGDIYFSQSGELDGVSIEITGWWVGLIEGRVLADPDGNCILTPDGQFILVP